MEPPILFFLFSHTPTEVQLADARKTLGVDHFVTPPPEIGRLWRQVPPDLDTIDDYLTPVKHWLAGRARKGDFVLIQGDFGATYRMVRFALEGGFIPIYSTTERRAVEQHEPDGRVRLSHTFYHCRFRRYET
ncbi:MAG: CRISPR-associated protein Csx20 [Pseudomonadota bacterium]